MNDFGQLKTFEEKPTSNFTVELSDIHDHLS